MKQNKNGKPRKTFELAVSVVKQRTEKAWEYYEHFRESEEFWYSRKDDPKHTAHYEMVVKEKAIGFERWSELRSAQRALEAIENG